MKICYSKTKTGHMQKYAGNLIQYMKIQIKSTTVTVSKNV